MSVGMRSVLIDFYPRPPWGGRRRLRLRPARLCDFYPRPPWGGRPLTDVIDGVELVFLSTPSVGRATEFGQIMDGTAYDFYPRPPWGGRPEQRPADRYGQDFYPRPPWGGRRARVKSRCLHIYFYPRPPWGGRLYDRRDTLTKHLISIHALRGEGDLACLFAFPANAISIHALRGEGDNIDGGFRRSCK